MTGHQLTYRNKQIAYFITGKGKPLVLLHGYQSDSRAWNDLIPFLKDRFQLIMIDLPGHGKSELVEDVNAMELMADVVLSVIDELNLVEVSVVGHSMGGYVALAMAEQAPDLVKNLYLINSHPFADSEKRIKDRKREMKLIADGKKEVLLKSFTHLNFAEENREKLRNKVVDSIKIGLDQPEDGILADIKGLMIRKDRAQVLSASGIDCCILYGAEEKNFPKHEVQALAPEIQVALFEMNGCSHMSIVEDAQSVAEILLR